MDILSSGILSGIAYIGIPLVLVVFLLITFIAFYKKCPPNQLLVVYGKTFGKTSAKVIHGGGCLVIPVFQDSEYMSLAPMDFNIDLQDALSSNNIRINVPAVCTVAIGSTGELTQNASERLLGMTRDEVKDAAENITIGQLRSVIASLSIEEINGDRQEFDDRVRNNIDGELAKLGLYIVNLNIKDVTDNSGYIDAIGQKASAKVVQQALIDVAEEEKRGAIGKASAKRERDVAVAEQEAESEKSITQTEATRDIFIASKDAERIKGKNEASLVQRESDADLEIKSAKFKQDSETAKYKAETEIQASREESELARKRVEDVVDEKIKAQKKIEEAKGDAEAITTRAKADAEAKMMGYQAEADGIKLVSAAQAEGFRLMVEAAGTPEAAIQMQMVDKIESLVKLQTEAVSKMKIDSINVWDGGSSNGQGGSGLKGFMRDFLTAGAPLSEIAKTVGFELPAFLGSHNPDAKLAVKKDGDESVIDESEDNVIEAKDFDSADEN